MLNAECRVMCIESRFCCDRQRKFFAVHPATMKAASEIGVGRRDRERAFWISYCGDDAGCFAAHGDETRSWSYPLGTASLGSVALGSRESARRITQAKNITGSLGNDHACISGGR